MIKDFFLKNWDLFFNEPKPLTLQVVPISSCLYDYGNDIVLLFPPYSTYPEYVVKIARSAKYNFKLHNEYDALKALFEKKELSKFVPYPHHLGEVSGKTFFIQGGFSGSNLFNLIKEKGLTSHTKTLLNDAVDLLVTINASGVNVDESGDQCQKREPDTLKTYRRELINLGIAEQNIEIIRDEYHSLKNKNSYFLHGDYWQTNILVENRKIKGIIDWEFAARNASVPMDIFWFLINLAYCIHSTNNNNSNISDSFRNVFFGEVESGVQSLISSLLQRYFQSDFDPKLVRLYLKLTLIEMSLREFKTYGSHTNMDKVCVEMLKHLMNNSNSFFLK